MTRKIKLIASDLDGTLLTGDKRILPSSLETIEKARQAGVLFTVVTGRPLPSARRYIEVTGADVPVVLYNGALIVNFKSGEVLRSMELETEDAARILALAEELDTTACVWSQQKLYSNRREGRIHEYKKLSQLEPIFIDDPAAIVAQGITKVIFDDEPERISRFARELKGEPFKNVTLCVSDPDFLEFFNGQVSKGDALCWLGQYCGISPKEMLALGDADNDVPMLECAGVGAAMKNSSPAALAAGNFVTGSNDEDGFSQAVERFVLNP